MKIINLVLVTLLTLASFTNAYALRISKKDSEPQIIEIHAKKFAYIPDEITLQKGKAYELHLTSDDVPHSFRIKALDLNVKLKYGEFNNVLFTPETAGNFKVDCGIYCGSGHTKMFMTVHVVDK